MAQLRHLKPLLREQTPDRRRREEEEMIWNYLPPAGTEKVKPGVGDIRCLDHEVAAGLEKAPELAQFRARIMKMFDDMIKDSDVKAGRRKVGRGESPIPTVHTPSPGAGCRRPVSLHASHFELTGGRQQKLPGRASDLQQPASIDETEEIRQPLLTHGCPPWLLGMLDLDIDQVQLTRPERQALHRRPQIIINIIHPPNSSPGIDKMEPADRAAQQWTVKPGSAENLPAARRLAERAAAVRASHIRVIVTIEWSHGCVENRCSSTASR